MKTASIAKLSAVVCLSLSLLIVIAYIATRDRPLGEGHRLASDYGGEFTLQSHQGRVSLSDFKGKVVVIYFGFMNCQEACPVSMTTMRRAFKRLSSDELKQVQGIFISIDPKRDTPEDLAAFVRDYHPNVIGLVDDKATIKQLAEQYGALADMDVLEGKSVTYTVEHSSRFYMVDRVGKLQTTMSHSTTPAELAAKIQQMLQVAVKANNPLLSQ